MAFKMVVSWTAAAGRTYQTAYRSSCGRIGNKIWRSGIDCIRTIPFAETREKVTATKTRKLFLLGSGANCLLSLRFAGLSGSRPAVDCASAERGVAVRLWLTASLNALDDLLQEALRIPTYHRGLGGLLTLHPPRTESIQPLDDLFDPFVWSTEKFRWLPLAELAEVLADDGE